MDRRRFLSLAAAGMASTAFRAHALEIGEATLRTVSDGQLSLPPDFLFSAMPQDQLGAVLTAQGIDRTAPLTPPCNVTVLQDADRVVLFDAGSGSNFQDGVGTLIDALDHIDIAPEDVTHIVFTHGHPDHLWGVLDDFDDLTFPDAVPMMGQAEHAYWSDPATVESIGEARAAFAAGALRRLQAIGGDMVLFEGGEDILPGITAVSTPGHTPGHMAFRIAFGPHEAMVVGDAIGNPHIAFARPEWPSGSDQDRALGAKTRARLLDQLATDAVPMVGFHLPDGGIGRAIAVEDGYRFDAD